MQLGLSSFESGDTDRGKDGFQLMNSNPAAACLPSSPLSTVAFSSVPRAWARCWPRGHLEQLLVRLEALSLPFKRPYQLLSPTFLSSPPTVIFLCRLIPSLSRHHHPIFLVDSIVASLCSFLACSHQPFWSESPHAPNSTAVGRHRRGNPLAMASSLR
jgi:hypothetical protein